MYECVENLDYNIIMREPTIITSVLKIIGLLTLTLTVVYKRYLTFPTYFPQTQLLILGSKDY